jgi:acylphosphatase
MVAKRVVYEGRVQGVGFRFSVKDVARGYEVAGWVKNLIDGRVQLEVQGERGEVEAFLEAVQQSHLCALISRRTIQEVPKLEGVKGFEIRW